jgi:hypothetical protein
MLPIFIYACVISTKAGLRSGEIAVAGDEWPIFLYDNSVYDPEHPWDGLFRNGILISVRTILSASNSDAQVDHDDHD